MAFSVMMASLWYNHSRFPRCSLGLFVHSVDNPFHREPYVMSIIKSPYNPLSRGCVWGQATLTPWSTEFIGFWMARDIVHYQKNFKRQLLTGEVFPDSRDKASVQLILKKGSHCSGFLVVQSKDWQMVSISFLQSWGFSFIDKGILGHKPDCIFTKQ